MKSMYRPKIHFTPENNWMNDPNGLVYDASAKEYHLFFQYCDSLSEDQSKKYWGHAVSCDLVHWTELATAIEPDNLGGVWSGSCVIDRNNTSGFFDDSTPADARMVAFFTYALGDETYGWQKQAVAYSKDHGRTWIKYEGNPVIKGKDGDTILYDNRDPKVFWYPDAKRKNGGIWVMIIAGMWARIFTSENLRDWNFQGDVMYADGVRHIESECPDLFPLPLDGKENQIKWVYTGGGRFCVIGELVCEDDGRFVFCAETEQISPIVGCDDMYAAQSFYNDSKNRKIGIYWMIDKTADKLSEYGKTWDGYQSLPLEYRLVSTADGPKLMLRPVEEIAAARSNKPVFTAENKVIDEKRSCFIDDIKDVTLDIDAIIDVQSCSSFEINLREADNRKIVLRYSKNEQLLYLGRSTSGLVLGGTYSMKLCPTQEGKIKLRIILDMSVIDVFANDGEAMFNAIVFPEKTGGAVNMCAYGGTAVLDKLDIYSIE